MPPHTRVVVDSTADLPSEWLAHYDIRVIPAYVNFGTESFPDDGVALTHAEFYRRVAETRGHPTTAAPSLGVTLEILRTALEGVEQVLALTISSSFSGINNVFNLAAKEIGGDRITVIDSGYLSMGLGWQALAAAKRLHEGGTMADAIAAAHDVRQRSDVWAAPNDLEFLRRGGRVNALMAGIGTLLQVKPIISLKEGEVRTIQRVRTMNKAKAALIEMVQKSAPLQHLALMHTNDLQGAEMLRDALSFIAPEDTPIINVGTATGTQFGPGSLGVSIVRKAF